MTVFSKIVDRIMKVCEWIVLIFLAISVLDIGLQVFCRKVLGSPLAWTEQVARYLFIWMTMLGLPILFKRGFTLAFTLIFDSLPAKVRVAADIFIKAAGLAFSVYYFRSGVQYCIAAGSRLAPGIQIPLNVVYSAQPVGAALLFLVLLSQISEDLAGALRSGREARKG